MLPHLSPLHLLDRAWSRQPPAKTSAAASPAPACVKLRQLSMAQVCCLWRPCSCGCRHLPPSFYWLACGFILPKAQGTNSCLACRRLLSSLTCSARSGQRSSATPKASPASRSPVCSPPVPGRCCPPIQRSLSCPTPMKMQGNLGQCTLVVAEVLKLAPRQSRWLHVCSGPVCPVPDGRDQWYACLTD